MTPRAYVAGDQLVFGNDRIAVHFDRHTGRWLTLVDRRSDLAVLEDGASIAPVVVVAGGKTTWTSGRDHLRSLIDTRTYGQETRRVSFRTRTRRGVTWLELDTRDGPWRIVHRFGMKAGDAALQRGVRLTFAGKGEALLRWVELRTPVRARLEDALLEAPGYPGVLHQRLSDLPRGVWDQMPDEIDRDVPAWRMGLLILRHLGKNMLLWGHDQEVPSFMLVRRGDRGVWFIQKMLACCRMKSGTSLDVGTQHVRLCEGDVAEAIAAFKPFWNSVGLVKKERETPPWIGDARIYEAHIGTKSFPSGRSHAPYPEVKDLTSDLGRIRDLGFNIVELMPHQPYPSYSVHDYHDVTTHYGPAEEVRTLIRTAHAAGMRVLFDVVMHGVRDERHPYLEKHPEWFLRTEDGDFARTYTISFDHANRSFVKFVVDVFSYYVREYDVDGFRVDAITWNSFPNWASRLPYPGYRSFYGSADMFDRVRKAVRKLKPDVLFYTETLGPLFAKSYDLFYNYDEQWVFGLLPLESRRGFHNYTMPPRPFTAPEVAEWLAYRDTALPDRFIKVHHVDSHDTHEWGGMGMFRREAFGAEAQRMLFAFCAFSGGGIMNYAGGEEGSEPHYRTVIGLRESIIALREGSCDFLAVASSDERLFTPLRRAGSTWAVPICSFAAEPVTAEIDLSAVGLAAGSKAREMFSNEVRALSGTKLPVSLPRFGVELWVPEP